jgi:hypothetical protein
VSTTGHVVSQHELEQRLAADFEATFDRKPHRPQLRNMVALWPIIEAGLREQRRDDAVKRSVPQMARQMAPVTGWDVSGGAKRVHQRCRNMLNRSAGYLIEMGWLESWEVDQRDANRATILLRVPAGVAQSVRAAES